MPLKRSRPLLSLPLFTLWLAMFGTASRAEAANAVVIRSIAEMRQALKNVRPNTTLRFGPGEYPGGLAVRGIEGLIVEALDEKAKPVFRGGRTGWQFSQCADLTVRNLVITGQSMNGLNIDDGGQRESPVRGVKIEGVEVRDIGPKGNFDGIKLSGLDEFVIRNCRFEGWAGQGIDMVGCHRGQVSDCEFRGKESFSASAGIQMKGGCSELMVEKCRFVHAGERPLNIGGSTGTPYFRPPGAKFEARAITVRDCVMEGSLCAAAFVGLDGGEFSGNTVLYPEKWIFRILQETRAEGFAPCRNVVVRGNRIVFRRAQVTVDINIGLGTAPETFTFANNRWFAEDRPEASKPKLPIPETNGEYGIDPR